VPAFLLASTNYATPWSIVR